MIDMARYRKHCAFATTLFLTPLAASAAGTVLEAFDDSNCRTWQLSDEIVETNTPISNVQQRLIDNAVQQAKSQQLRTQLVGGGIYKMQQRPTDYAESVGSVSCVITEPMNIARSATYISTLKCFTFIGDQTQQLSYRTSIKDSAKWSPATYVCTPDCAGYPVKAVFELPWEDGPTNQAHARSGRAFYSKCKK